MLWWQKNRHASGESFICCYKCNLICLVVGQDEKSKTSTGSSLALVWSLTWLLGGINGTGSDSWLTWRRSLTTLWQSTSRLSITCVWESAKSLKMMMMVSSWWFIYSLIYVCILYFVYEVIVKDGKAFQFKTVYDENYGVW